MVTHQFTGDKLTKIEVVIGTGKKNVIHEGPALEDLGLGSYTFVIENDHNTKLTAGNGTREKSLTLAIWALDTTILEFNTEGAGEPYGSKRTIITCTWGATGSEDVAQSKERRYQAAVNSINTC